MRYLLALILLLLSPVAAAEDKPAYVELSDEAQRINQKHDHRGAIAKAKEALSLAIKTVGPEHQHIADIQYYIGQYHGSLGEWVEAHTRWQTSLQIYEKAVGKEHIFIAQVLEKLTMSAVNLSRYDEALAASKRALQVAEALEVEPG